MAKRFTEKQIRTLWGNGKTLLYKGKRYTVHKMSYGDYFLELAIKKSSETDSFTDEELWL